MGYWVSNIIKWGTLIRTDRKSQPNPATTGLTLIFWKFHSEKIICLVLNVGANLRRDLAVSDLDFVFLICLFALSNFYVVRTLCSLMFRSSKKCKPFLSLKWHQLYFYFSNFGQSEVMIGKTLFLKINIKITTQKPLIFKTR